MGNNSVYGDAVPVKELSERVASYVHLCTLYWWLRFVVPIHLYLLLVFLLA